MEYRYKPTTNGRNALAAGMALEKPPKITRVAFGSGKAAEDVNLADVHALLSYVSEGAVADRRHEGDRFFLTIQYANSAHQDVKMFLLSEFIVYVEDPETGGDTDLLYGTLGDYRQPVPAYNPAFPPSIFNFPLELIISDEIQVVIAAPAGLVTHDELITVVERNVEAFVKANMAEEMGRHNNSPDAHPDIRRALEDLQQNIWQYLGEGVVRAERLDLTIPAAGWVESEGAYPWYVDVPHARITEDAAPQLTVLPGSLGIAGDCNLCQTVETLPGALRVWAKAVPAADITASLLLLKDVRSKEEITIPAIGWVDDEDTAGEFALHVDIAVENSREELVPMLTILPAFMSAAGLCGMSSNARTMDGILRVYAKFVPDKPIKAQLILLETVSSGTSGSYTLPVATAHTLGGVKVQRGSGLTVDGSGNLAIDAAGSGDVEELFGSDAGDSVE